MMRVLVVVWTIVRVAAVVLLVGWGSWNLRLLDAPISVALPERLKPEGMALLVIGEIIVLVCGGILSTPGVLPTDFVAFGPFRYVRNPMSLGAVTMMFGWALVCRSISILILSVTLFLALHGFVVFVEEPGLEKRFGNSYLQYKRSVHRWIPSCRISRRG
ncbi:MAG: hypothetical protein DMG99_20600 [Acidobacteria bacterium]|nr:MAG: hypothetical protein DMG99_20600 [Acidobacteriota bacterium]